ncbi:hypothetical protein GCM10010246_76240 [Streptomyces cuspidosporus]|uniref:Uncharacterized protein n=1 Tax=Streptomyces cuspidosporus TaxID=66882 RepID=A0ABN3H6V8_9ACTN
MVSLSTPRSATSRAAASSSRARLRAASARIGGAWPASGSSDRRAAPAPSPSPRGAEAGWDGGWGGADEVMPPSVADRGPVIFKWTAVRISGITFN